MFSTRVIPSNKTYIKTKTSFTQINNVRVNCMIKKYVSYLIWYKYRSKVQWNTETLFQNPKQDFIFMQQELRN